MKSFPPSGAALVMAPTELRNVLSHCTLVPMKFSAPFGWERDILLIQGGRGSLLFSVISSVHQLATLCLLAGI